MLDSKRRVWLLEANSRPSLNCDSLKDMAIKKGLLTSTLKLLSIVPPFETERAGQDHSEDESDNEVSEEEEEGGEEDGDTDGEDDDNDDDPEAKVGLSRAERTQRMQSQSQVLASSPALRKLCGASYATVHPEGETLESLFAPRSPLLVFKQPLLEALFDRYAGGKGLLSSSKFFQLMTDMSLFRPNEKERSQSLYQQVCMSRMDGRMHFGLFCGALAQLAQQRKSVV